MRALQNSETKARPWSLYLLMLKHELTIYSVKMNLNIPFWLEEQSLCRTTFQCNAFIYRKKFKYWHNCLVNAIPKLIYRASYTLMWKTQARVCFIGSEPQWQIIDFYIKKHPTTLMSLIIPWRVIITIPLGFYTPDATKRGENWFECKFILKNFGLHHMENSTDFVQYLESRIKTIISPWHDP